MLEIVPLKAAVILCLADPETLGDLPPLADATAFRVAPDEVLFVGPPDARESLLERLAAVAGEGDPASLVLDQSGGWDIFAVTGPDRERIFERLAAFRIPDERPTFVQGVMAQVPTKVLLDTDGIHLLVRAPVGHHFARRVIEACRDLGARAGEASEFRALEPAAASAAARAVGLGEAR